MMMLSRSCLGFLSRAPLTSSKRASAWPSLARTFSAQSEDISVISPSSDHISTIESLSQSELIDFRFLSVPPLDLKNVNTTITPVREAWIENMSTPNSIKLGILPLNPRIFSAFPKPDVIQQNHKWQNLYKHVDWRCMKNRAELSGSGKKPWPQKKLGRARHSSKRAPQWIGGGWATGPRGPRTYFYMLPWHARVNGLIAMLSAKFSQNDIHVVDSFESFPLDGTAAHVEELCETRGWGPSVLFVDKVDIELAPRCTNADHFYKAAETINHINIFPMYSLNVFSMLKHETLVLTVDAIKDIEEKLVAQLNRVDLENVIFKYKPDGVYRL